MIAIYAPDKKRTTTIAVVLVGSGSGRGVGGLIALEVLVLVLVYRKDRCFRTGVQSLLSGIEKFLDK